MVFRLLKPSLTVGNVPNTLGNDTEMWETYSNLYIGRSPHILISLKQVLTNETWLAI